MGFAMPITGDEDKATGPSPRPFGKLRATPLPMGEGPGVRGLRIATRPIHRLRRASAVLLFSLLLLSMGRGNPSFSPIDLAAAPFRFDLITWEITHLPDKWFHKLGSLLPWNSDSRQERLDDLKEYFRLGQEIRAQEEELTRLQTQSDAGSGSPGSAALTGPQESVRSVLERLEDLRGTRSGLKAGVEETLESEVSAVLDREGLDSFFGLVFPPVDVAIASPPRVLVISPRDRIDRIKTVLLKPDMKLEDMDTLEDRILQEQDLSALVTGIGGVATYPTIVRDSSLRSAAELSSHEWLHAYWFFRPLGWAPWSWSSEINTLNETAASLAGRELGKLVHEAITGEKILEPPPSSSTSEEDTTPPDEGHFDFNNEMHATRLRVDELLAEGKVVEAEAYMEERRQLFEENGHHIRKLNQAFFAFHGTYAASPASVSPIGDEVEQLWSTSDSVGDFIRTMAGFGSYQEFQDFLDQKTGQSRNSPVRGDSASR